MTWKSRTPTESFVISLPENRVVPVAFPATHHLAKHREEQIIQPFPGEHLRYFNEELPISVQRSNNEKMWGISICAAYEGNLKTNNPAFMSFLPCCPSPPTFAFSSALSFLYHPEMTSRKQGWKRGCESSKLGDTKLVGRDVGWEDKDRTVTWMLLLLRWRKAVPQVHGVDLYCHL